MRAPWPSSTTGVRVPHHLVRAISGFMLPVITTEASSCNDIHEYPSFMEIARAPRHFAARKISRPLFPASHAKIERR